MEIRKILDLLEAGTRFKNPAKALDEEPVVSFGKTFTPPGAAATAPEPAAKPVVGTGLVAGSETQGGQVSYGSGASAQRSPASAATTSSAPPAGGTPFTNPVPNVTVSPTAVKPTPAASVDTVATAARNNAAAQPTSAAAPTTKTYGGGYDPSKVQYAYGGPTASATQSAALDTRKAGAIGGQTASGIAKNITASYGKMAEENPNTSAGAGKVLDAVSKTFKTIDPAAQTKSIQPVRPGSASAYVGGSVDATAGMSDTSAAIPNTDSKLVNDPMKDFEESIEEMTIDELAEMRRLSGLPLNEKAVSKQQQKFMGMVHAMQKGEKVKGASPELKKAAKTMGKKDAKDFASTKHKGLPQKVSEGVNFVEMMRETEQTLEEMLTELHDEITEYKMTGHMGDKLRDAMELHRYNKNKLMGEANMVYEDDALNELAALAGLSEDGPGAAALYGKDKSTADKMQSGADAVADFVRKGAKAYQGLYMTGLGMPPDEYTPADPRKPFGPRKSEMPKNEDGPGQFGMQKKTPPKPLEMKPTQPGVEPVAQFAADLGMPELPGKAFTDKEREDYRKIMKAKKSGVDENQDLTECGDMSMDAEDSMNVSTNMSSDGTRSVNISAQGGKADELLQMLKMAGMRPHDDHDHSSMSKPEVIMIGSDDMMDEELEEAKKRTTRYVNTPDEEYQTVASITRQGNDLNREKKQFAKKARLGDNPMAESVFDADLDAMLESILIRDDKDESEIKRDPVTGRVSATFPPPKKEKAPDQSELPLQNEPYHGPCSLKVDGGKRTGTENFGDDDKEIYEKMDDLDEQGSSGGGSGSSGGGQTNPYPIDKDALPRSEKFAPLDTHSIMPNLIRFIKGK